MKLAELPHGPHDNTRVQDWWQQFWHMQVGTVFFDAPYGKTTATAGETHQETCKVIYSPEG